MSSPSASPEAYDTPVSNYANDDALESSIAEHDNEGGSPVTITTTIGSGPNKRKEVMTLPLPPGALPPRKRAKTKDEKEQRRIERIMRNRQAAHASREKKRRHVEDLEKMCASLSSENDQLQSQVQQLKSSYSEVNDHTSFLRSKIDELVGLVEAAKKSGDMAVLETAKFMQDVDSKLTTTISPLSSQESQPPSLVNDHDSDTSSENGSLATPSLSSSVANSPLANSLDIMIKQEENDSVQISLPEETPFFGLVDSRSHHPAEVMKQYDQQRRPPNPQRTSPTLSSSTT